MPRRTVLILIVIVCISTLTAAQTRHRKRVSKPTANPQAPKGSAAEYSAFLHASEKHKTLECNACHKLPTAWTARRDFPDVADFPDHNACVRCHRQQFFTRQAFVGPGPAICIVCHVRVGPREDARFAFGNPNNANQTMKSKEQRQFMIEFPHDRHQNVIALLRQRGSLDEQPRIVRASFFLSSPLDEDQKPDYNNCSICHVTNRNAASAPARGWTDSFTPPTGTFKTVPHAHDACFDCHWRNQKPAGNDCGGCHKPAPSFVPANWPKRVSAKFSHEGGKGEHALECTTCHINITRASTLRGLTADVPIAACATCHKDNKKTTYPKMTTIEEEFEAYQKSSACRYCHTPEVGKKNPPASHYAAAQ